MSVRAAIFDLDGTLVESLPGLTIALNLTLEELGLETISAQVVRGYIGDGMWMLLRRALPREQFTSDEVSAAQSIFQRHYAHHWQDGTAPFDGIMELLSELRDQGVQLGVLSNKPHDFTVEIVEQLFGRDLIPIIYGQRAEVPKKPDPRALIELCNDLQLPASEVAYIGDSTVDLETAQAAGTQDIGVTWGYHDRELLETYNAPLYDRIAELRAALR